MLQRSPKPQPQSRLTLVTNRVPRYSPIALWHLLSLDAPTVAALWTVFLARCAGLTLPWTAPAAMFVAVWMLYAADRLLDARPLPNGTTPPDLEARHRFHHRHRSRFLSAIAVASIALALLLHRIDARALHLYALLAALLATWLLLIHARAAGAHRLPKELAVGLFFPAAVFVPTVARAPHLQLTLLPFAALFSTVCTLNCLFLYLWEHPRDRSHAHWTTRWATQHLLPLALITLTAALALSSKLIHSPLETQHVHRIAQACAVSVALLLLLHTNRNKLSALTLRACADVALLTPVLFLLR